MVLSSRIGTFAPRESSLNWLQDTPVRTAFHWAARNQNHGSRFILSYAAGALALVNIATLPLATVLDTVIGVWHAARSLFYEVRVQEPPSLSRRSIYPILHLKIAGKCAGWTLATVPYFYPAYYFSAISCMLCSLHIPRVGRYLGAASVVYIMHFPIGWCAANISQTFVEYC